MANIILKLIPNKWDSKHFFSFLKKNDKRPKDCHFLAHNNYKKEIVAGEFWECFVWSKRELQDKVLFKVVPYQKIEESRLRDERKRVNQFNRELAHMEKFVGPEFDKVVFKDGNKPFLHAKSGNREALAERYPIFLFLDDPELGLLAKPPAPKPPARKPFGKPFQKRPYGDRGGRPGGGYGGPPQRPAYGGGPRPAYSTQRDDRGESDRLADERRAGYAAGRTADRGQYPDRQARSPVQPNKLYKQFKKF